MRFTRFAAAVLVLTSAIAVSAIACSMTPPDCSTVHACDRLAIREDSAISDRSVIEWNGRRFSLIERPSYDVPADGECYANIGGNTTESPPGSGTRASPELTISCNDKGSQILLHTTLDLASMSVGTTAAHIHGWVAPADQRGPDGITPTMSQRMCDQDLPSTIDISIAVGGPAPFPASVTTDFVREFDVKIHDASCGQLDLAAHFRMRASDFTGYANVSCGGCDGVNGS